MFLLTRISNVSYLYCSCSFEKFTSSFAFVKEGRFSLGERRENGAGGKKGVRQRKPRARCPALTFLCPIPRPRGIPAPVWFRFVPALVSVLSKYTRLLPQRCQKNAAQPYLSHRTRGAGENALSHLIVLLYRFAQPLSSRKAAGLPDIPRAPLLKKREKRRSLSKKRKEGGRKVFAVHPQDAPVFSKRLAAKSKTRRPRLCGSPPHRQVFPKSRGPSQEKLLPFRPNTQAGCCIQASVGEGFPPYSPGGERAF